MNRNAPTINAGPALPMATLSNVRSGSRSPSPSGVTGGPTLLQKAGGYAGHAAAVAEATASGFAIASVAKASAFVPLAGASGGAWVAAAALSELDNSGPRDNVASAANVINGVAGAMQLTTAFLSGSNQTKVAYTSAATWAANAATNIGKAIADRGRNTTSRVAQGASGVLNLGAAALTAAAAVEASKGNSVKSTNLGIASGALWTGGAAAAMVAAWVSQRQASAVPPLGSDA